MSLIDPEVLKKLVDDSITRRFESDSRSERPLIVEDITDGIHYERRRIREIVLAMIPEWAQREAQGASIKQALEDVLDRISS